MAAPVTSLLSPVLEHIKVGRKRTLKAGCSVSAQTLLLERYNFRNPSLLLEQWFSTVGDLAPKQNLWKYLETWVVSQMSRACYWHLMGRAPRSPQQRTTQPRVSAVPRWRHSGGEQWFSTLLHTKTLGGGRL